VQQAMGKAKKEKITLDDFGLYLGMEKACLSV